MKASRCTVWIIQIPRFFAAVLLASGTSFAGTAYEALRTVGHKYGEDTLERVVEVQGSGNTWNVIALDPDAPSTVQAFRVRNDRVLSRTKRAVDERWTAPINLDALNLDSDGALTKITPHLQAPEEAKGATYTLSNKPDRSTAVWEIQLKGASIGGRSSFEVSASDGSVISIPSHQTAHGIAADEHEPAPDGSDGGREAIGASVDTATVATDDFPKPEEAPAVVGEPAISEDPRREFRKSYPRASRNRARTRVVSPPAIVRRVAKKASKPVRVVRRILPF